MNEHIRLLKQMAEECEHLHWVDGGHAYHAALLAAQQALETAQQALVLAGSPKVIGASVTAGKVAGE